MMILPGTKLYLRCQPRTQAWYVVQGLTPLRFMGCPLFYPSKVDALAVLRSRGWEPIPDSDELRRVGGCK